MLTGLLAYEYRFFPNIGFAAGRTRQSMSVSVYVEQIDDVLLGDHLDQRS
jgi:hypothetical protein